MTVRININKSVTTSFITFSVVKINKSVKIIHFHNISIMFVVILLNLTKKKNKSYHIVRLIFYIP